MGGTTKDILIFVSYLSNIETSNSLMAAGVFFPLHWPADWMTELDWKKNNSDSFSEMSVTFWLPDVQGECPELKL